MDEADSLLYRQVNRRLTAHNHQLAESEAEAKKNLRLADENNAILQEELSLVEDQLQEKETALQEAERNLERIKAQADEILRNAKLADFYSKTAMKEGEFCFCCRQCWKQGCFESSYELVVRSFG